MMLWVCNYLIYYNLISWLLCGFLVVLTTDVSKCEREVSSSSSQMLSYQFILLHFWLPAHHPPFMGVNCFFAFYFLLYFSTAFPPLVFLVVVPVDDCPQLCSSLTLLFIPLEICFSTFPLLFTNGWLLFLLLSKQRACMRNDRENNKKLFIQSKQQSTFVRCAYHVREPCYLCTTMLL